jgi:hypothetical protein
MGYVYLIGEIDNSGKYKIGSTRGKSVAKRLKQLQTGSSSELYVKDAVETDHPFKLEKMLHNHFKSSNLIGEWFELSEYDVDGFKDLCSEKLKVIDSLKENPFYFNARIVPMKIDFDKPDRNGRVYSQESMKELIEDFNFRLKEYGDILGELNHPLQ